MLFRSRRRDPAPPALLVPRPSWENATTEVFPTVDPGRAGSLTPAQRWRAGGWRRHAGPRGGTAR